MEMSSELFRWVHVIAGVMWIGLLWFFNFVNIPFAAKMKEAGAAGTVVPELMPRALFWFRWGAAWTWVTGVLLLLLVFYHGGVLFDDEATNWGTGPLVMIAVTFLAVFVYDLLFKSGLAAKNIKAAYTIAFVLVAVTACLMARWAGFGYRGMSIHV
ncbi:MAG: urate hydroxylase PuuD, partial [Candidatus Binatia bacterium]